MPIVIEIDGVSQLRDKLGRFQKQSRFEAEQLLHEAAMIAKTVAQGAAPRDLGMGAENIEIEVRDAGYDVVSPDDYMVVQEFGRRAGQRQPSTDHIAGWAERHGFVGKGAAYVLARSIGRKGFPGKHFMQKGAKAADQFVKSNLAKAAAHMEAWWNGD